MANSSVQNFPDEWYSYAEADHFWFDARLKVLIHMLKQIPASVESPLKILDVGCGNGAFAKQLEDCTQWIVDGVDLSESAVQASLPRRGHSKVYDVFLKPRELERAYDVIVLFDILEHIDDTKQFIDAVSFYLKPGGLILANVPALMSMYSGYDRVAGHLRRYDKTTLNSEFQSHQFVPLRNKYWGLALIPVLFIRKFIVLFIKNPSQILKIGFMPPHPFFNNLFKLFLGIERTLTSNPIRGSSVMAAYRKT